MLFMVIEHFRDGDPAPVYRRLRERGRLLPAGVEYVASWLEECGARIQVDDVCTGSRQHAVLELDPQHRRFADLVKDAGF